MTSTTLVLIKPDAIQRRISGLVLDRLESLGLELVGAKAARVSRQLAEEHYAQLREKPFFQEILEHLCGERHGVSYVWALVYHGPDAIARLRQLAGATNPDHADPSTLRGAFGRNSATGVMENIVHASSNAAEAEREVKLWFRPDELLRPLFPTKAEAGNRRTAWRA